MKKHRPLARLLILAILAMAVHGRGEEDPAAQRYFTGNALYNRKMYKLAIEEYKQFLADTPTHAKADAARTGMAMSHYALGNYAEAAPLFKALLALENVKDAAQLRLLLAQSLLKLNKLAEAEKHFATLTGNAATGASQPLALAGLLETQYGQKKWKPVITTGTALINSKPDAETRKRALYQVAYACHQLKQYQDAIPHLEALQPLVKAGGLEHQVAFFLAESYRMTGDLAAAATQYAMAATGFKGDIGAEINYRLGFVRFRQQQVADAADAMQKSLAQAPAGFFSGEARLLLGRCYLEQKQMEQAATVLDSLCSATNAPAGGGVLPLAEATIWRARIYSRSGAYNKAESFITTMLPRLDKSPLVPDLQFDRANALIAQNKHAAAVNALAAVLQHTGWPQANDARRLYAICLHHKGDFAASLKQADRFIADHPRDPLMPEVRFVRAENLYFLKKFDEANKAYATFLAASPKHASAAAASFRRVQILHRNEKWEDALQAGKALAISRPSGNLFSQLDFILGDCSFRLKQWQAAVVHLGRFMTDYPLAPADGAKQKEPNADAACIEMAIAQVNLQQPEAAIKHLTDLAKHAPNSPHLPLALAELGRLHYDAKNHAEARKALQRFVKVAPKHAQRPQVESYLGWIALAEKKDAEAESHFKAVVTQHADSPAAPESFLQLGLVQLAQKKYPDAQQTLASLLATFPNHPRKALATFSLGVSFARQKKWSEAIPQLKAVMTFEDSQHQPRALYELAWCEKGLNRKDAAADWYRSLIKNHPSDKLVSKVRTELAELTFEAKNYDEVIEQLQQTLGDIKDPALKEQTTYRLGTAYFNKGDAKQSARTFETFITEFPQSTFLGSAHFQAGESCMKLKEMIRARDHFLAASKVKGLPTDLRESILIRLGETQALTDQWAESAASYTQFVAEFPKSQWLRNARFGLAWAQEKQGKYKEAMAGYKQVITPDKDELSAKSQFQIGECLFADKQYDEAIKALIPVQITYRYEDWAAKALLETGRIMEAKGDREAAMNQFTEVIRKFPKHNAAVVAKQRLDALRTGGI